MKFLTSLLVFALLSTATVAAAQEAPQKHFDLRLSEAQLNVVAAALNQIPYKDAAPVLVELQKQVSAQVDKPKADKK